MGPANLFWFCSYVSYTNTTSMESTVLLSELKYYSFTDISFHFAVSFYRKCFHLCLVHVFPTSIVSKVLKFVLQEFTVFIFLWIIDFYCIFYCTDLIFCWIINADIANIFLYYLLYLLSMVVWDFLISILTKPPPTTTKNQ